MKKLISIVLCLPVAILFSQNRVSSHSSIKASNCSVCHQCDIPTKTDPCLRACPHKGMSTEPPPPADVPDTLILDNLKGLSDLYMPVVFPHQIHAEMSHFSNGCTGCHHYNPPGKILPCADCHQASGKQINLSKVGLKGAYHRQCVGCHRAWNHSTECQGCHLLQSGEIAVQKPKPTPSKAVEPARVLIKTESSKGSLVTFYHNQHAHFLGFECTECHRNEQCSRCHDPSLKSGSIKGSKKEPHALCGECHNVEKDCSLCHGSTPKEPFDHGKRTGFSLTSFHSELTCNKCHVMKTGYSKVNKECTACHPEMESGAFDHRKAGLVLDDTHNAFECDMCHLEKKFGQTPSCSNCHEDFKYPDKLPGKRLQKITRKRPASLQKDDQSTQSQ